MKILDGITEKDTDELAEDIANDLKIFAVNTLYRPVGFSFDRGMNKVIMEQLREGHTVAVLKIYEPQDLPENQLAGGRSKHLIN